MSSGKSLSRFYLKPLLAQRAAGHGRIPGKSWKVFSGCLKAAPAGAIFPADIPVPPPAGDGCGSGRSWASGWISGEPCWPSWTKGSIWTGKRPSLTAASPRRKKGALRRKNQARQGYEVDGGGRRPGCSSWKHTGVGLAGGSQTDRRDPGAGKGAASGAGPASQAHAAANRRQSLRQRSIAQAVEGQKD